MTAESMSPVVAERAAKRSKDATAAAIRALKDSLAVAERRLRDVASMADKWLREGVDGLRAQTRPYVEDPAQTLDEAQRYLVERVRARPVTATLAGLGVGILLGVLLSSRGK